MKTIELYERIIATLLADAPLSAIVGGRVYSYIPQNAVYPYVSLGITTKESSNFTESDYVYTITMQIYSQQRTPREALVIRDRIVSLLNRNTDPINSPTMLLDYLQTTDTQKCQLEDDGRTWRVVVELCGC